MASCCRFVAYVPRPVQHQHLTGADMVSLDMFSTEDIIDVEKTVASQRVVYVQRQAETTSPQATPEFGMASVRERSRSRSRELAGTVLDSSESESQNSNHEEFSPPAGQYEVCRNCVFFQSACTCDCQGLNSIDDDLWHIPELTTEQERPMDHIPSTVS